MLTTAEQIREFKRCRRSFAYFLAQYLYVRTGGGEKFVPWPWQAELAEAIPHLQRVIILKARQLGMSWELGDYALWVAMFHPGADVLLMSQTKPDAKELLAKVKFAFEKLPNFLKPVVGADNSEVFEFPRLYSQLRAMPSTEKAGRGYTGRLILADEHAFHQWAEENLAATDPAIEAGGQFISLSSANGIGNLFADQCALASQSQPWLIPQEVPGVGLSFGDALKNARIRPGAWLPIFLPYNARPGRTEEWWESKKATYPRQWMIHQEYPRDPEEAFVQTGRPVFDPENLKKHKALCAEPLPREDWPQDWPAELLRLDPDELRVFALPEPGHRYVSGADVAEGLEHGDYSDLSVLDLDDASGFPTEVLTLHGHWDPDVFAQKIDQVARIYSGTHGVERNNHGLAVLLECKRLGTPGLYTERPVLNKQGQVIEPGKLGWLTSTTTKPLMIDDLAAALRDFGIRLSDRLAIAELTFYQTNKDGTTSAPSGKWDDRVMSRAIAVQMVKRAPQTSSKAVATAGVAKRLNLSRRSW